jgi:hypothetical protein
VRSAPAIRNFCTATGKDWVQSIEAGRLSLRTEHRD